jgi:hypothetical protein
MPKGGYGGFPAAGGSPGLGPGAGPGGGGGGGGGGGAQGPGRPIPAAGTGDFPAPFLGYWFDGDFTDFVGARDLTDVSANAVYAQSGILPAYPADAYTGLCCYPGTSPTILGQRTNADLDTLISSGDMTVCGLLRMDTQSPWGGMMFYMDTDASNTAWYFTGADNGADNRPRYSYIDDVGAQIDVDLDTLNIYVQSREWNFFVARRTHNVGVDCDVSVFMNGYKTNFTGLNEPGLSFAGNSRLGLMRSNQTSTVELDGGLCQAAYWNSALTDAQCRAIGEYVAPTLCLAVDP